MSDIISKIDWLVEKPRYLIDMFPSTVPKAADQRYFDVEEYFQNHREALDEKFCRILLKLYCYHDFWISAGNENMKNPSVNQLVELIRHCLPVAGRSGITSILSCPAAMPWSSLTAMTSI